MSFPIDFGAPNGLVMEPLENKTHAARFDLALDLSPMPIGGHQGAYLAAYEYGTDLFDERTIARMHEHFEQRIVKRSSPTHPSVSTICRCSRPRKKSC